MLDIMPSQRVEIKEEGQIESSMSPTTLGPKPRGIKFNTATIGEWPFAADSTMKTQAADRLKLSSLGSVDSRPNTQSQIPNSKSPRINNRAIRLKDDLASVMRSSGDRNGIMHRTLMDFNSMKDNGQILNYKMTTGIND